MVRGKYHTKYEMHREQPRHHETSRVNRYVKVGIGVVSFVYLLAHPIKLGMQSMQVQDMLLNPPEDNGC
jgi:hypothetical protein